MHNKFEQDTWNTFEVNHHLEGKISDVKLKIRENVKNQNKSAIWDFFSAITELD